MISFISKNSHFFLSLFMMMNSFLFTGCDGLVVNPVAPFYEDFTGDLRYWVLSGHPQPKLLTGFKDRQGVFDNNGDPNYPSGIMSKYCIKCTDGCTIETEVYLEFSDLTGCWASASIALTEECYPYNSDWPEFGQEFPQGAALAIMAEGDACWDTPIPFRRHSWVVAGIYAEDNIGEGVEKGTINADAYTNGWHKLKIVIRPDRRVQFFIDDDFIWQPTKKIHPSILEGTNVVLGNRSSGSAGKAYHDWVRVTPYSVRNTP